MFKGSEAFFQSKKCLQEGINDSRTHEKNFAAKWALNKPRCVRTSKKTFSCEICKKNFTTKSNLNKHTRIHAGEKPFSCEICKKNFTRKDSLKSHAFVHTRKKALTLMKELNGDNEPEKNEQLYRMSSSTLDENTNLAWLVANESVFCIDKDKTEKNNEILTDLSDVIPFRPADGNEESESSSALDLAMLDDYLYSPIDPKQTIIPCQFMRTNQITQAVGIGNQFEEGLATPTLPNFFVQESEAVIQGEDYSYHIGTFMSL